MEAKLVKRLTGGEFRGDARLYKLSDPLDGHTLVVVSAAVVPFSGPETYIFPANEQGEITDFGELNGSGRGYLDHREALSIAGYSIE